VGVDERDRADHGALTRFLALHGALSCQVQRAVSVSPLCDREGRGIMGGDEMATAMASPAIKLTYDDFALFPADGRRHELIDGEHFVSASPNRRHQVISRNLFRALDAVTRGRNAGEVFYAPFDVVFTRHDVVEPDLLFISATRTEILTDANVQGAPDLVIEVLSPSGRRYDEVLKRDLYERGGVAEYWLVDPEVETVKVFRRGADGRFERAELLGRREGDVLRSTLLPGLELPLDDVFAD
jgi:Uma2 family endonuclease